jgi:hypothetical protein
MTFTNPIWLWALSGLAIPIGIHLLSRKEGKVILIGSLRYLRESPTARFRHIRLNEIVLLILRCLLLTLIVFLLAGLTLNRNEYESKKWLIVEKGIENSERYQTLIDSLKDDGFELRLLGEGFPLVGDSARTKPLASYWSAVENLRSLGLDSTVVISYSLQKNFAGERVSLPSSISWFTEEPPAQIFTAQKILRGNDSVWIKTGFTSLAATKFETGKELSAPSAANQITPPDTIRVSIFADTKFRYDHKVLHAVLNAIQTITAHKIIVSPMEGDEVSDHADSRWVIWLSDKDFPYEHEKKIVLRACSINLPLLARADEVMEACAPIPASGYILTKRLYEETVLKEDFTVQLASLLLKETQYPKIVHDNRVLPEHQLWSKTNQSVVRFVKSANNTFNTVIIIALILTLLAERLLAYQRNQ